MNVLLSWMQEFAPITGEPEEIARTMTELGMVVESIQMVGPSWDGIIVAKVVALDPHPEADRIQLVSVDTGSAELHAAGEVSDDSLQICCGAFNMAVGDLVPLATLGTTMPGGMEIARRKLRGQWSNGMICSGPELEIAGEVDADGILVLPSDLVVGTPLVEALGVSTDIMFDLDIEGNRPDALSMIGVVRDLAAKQGVPFSVPERPVPTGDSVASERASVTIEAPELCQRFGFRVLDNVTIGESPEWMAQRLTAAGMRPINSIVDISNYVMLELGQPNHTYDLNKVADGVLSVRMGREGETITTLDDVERIITESDGVIANAADEPIGLAGVMGGASTEIGEDTTSVLLEAAIWDRMIIAKTVRRLNLRSEASTRYERGVDPEGVQRGLDRFCQLAIEICGATVASGTVVVDGNLVPTPPVRTRLSKINHLLGTDLTIEQVVGYLDPIGYTSSPLEDGVLSVNVPSWRPDSSIEEDIVEEVGRHHGYEKSGKRVPRPAQNGELTLNQLGRRRIRRAFLGAGYSEAMPMPFLAPDDLLRAGLADEGITLANPLVAEESVLRTSLLPGLLKAVAYNQSHRNAGVQLYELGRIYLGSDQELPDEQEWVAAIRAGADAVCATQLLDQLTATLTLRDVSLRNVERAGLHPTRSAEVVFRGRVLGEVGEIDPRVLEAYEIEGRVAWLQLNTAPILSALGNAPKYKKVSRFPSSDLDLAFVVDDKVSAKDVSRNLVKAGGKLVRSVKLFDVFRGEQVGEGKRSLAYAIRLQAADHTLEDEEVSKARQAMIDAVAKFHKGELR